MTYEDTKALEFNHFQNPDKASFTYLRFYLCRT